MLLRHDAGDVYAHADVLHPKERKKGFCRDEENAEKSLDSGPDGLLLTCCLVVGAQAAVGYEDVYGRTLDRVRVRASASMSAAIEDNIVSGACVFALDSDYVSGVTWIRVRYRDYEGDIATGWVCQNDGSTTYVQMLSRADAKNYFGVQDGDLPSKRVGTFTRADKTSSNQTSGSVNNYGYLQLGSESSAVTRLQQKLEALGYYDGEITGHFGEKTEAAVKAYQTKAGLYADGIAGPATQAKLFGTTTSSSSSAASKVNLTSEEIRKLQEDLKALGFYESGSVTGNYGTLTEEAVRQFQRKYGLDADGIAGTKTLAKIQSLLGSSSSGTGADASGLLKPGSNGTAVRQLQEDLKALGCLHRQRDGQLRHADGGCRTPLPEAQRSGLRRHRRHEDAGCHRQRADGRLVLLGRDDLHLQHPQVRLQRHGGAPAAGEPQGAGLL